MVIALADNIADSAGIHIYQEAECLKTKDVWFSTFTNFLTRILVSLTFVFLVILLPIKAAVTCSLIWGLLLLSYLSYTIARNRKVNPYLAVFEHIAIAVLVIVLSNFLGALMMSRFKL
jgi:VIT1/CCC1 family predicted Fe2+/Mn2+ transporter